jgi:predicted lipid-binding transport protein (Tim44 family)
LSLADPLLRYMFEAQRPHDALRRALIQLSGFLLLRTTGGRRAFIDFTPIEGARDAISEAADELRSLRVPTAAAHQKEHLEGAAIALQKAVAAAFSRSDPNGDALFRFVDEAEKHLKAVGRATPGFEAVDLRQACCAAHAESAPFLASGDGFK